MGEKSAGLGLGKATGRGVLLILRGTDMVDGRIAGLRVEDDKAADGGIRLHSAAFRKSDSKTFRQQGENVPLEAVVRAAGISCRRFCYLGTHSARVMRRARCISF